MPEILRLTPSQRSRCNRLIKRLCANFDDGNCLLLDDGESCICPQTISYSLLCRYFRNAVLPAEKELYADIFKQRTYHCAECGRLLCRTPTGRNTARRAAKGAPQAEKRAQKAQSGQLGVRKHPVYKGFLTPDRGMHRDHTNPFDFGVLTVRITKRKDVLMKRKLVTVDAETLLATPMSKTMFIVDGLIPQGVNV